MKGEKGIGLPELLIGLFLSTVIVSSLMQIYLNQKRHYLQFQSDLDLQFDLNWITDLMRSSIMSAGFSPCLSISHLTTVDRRKADQPLTDLSISSKPLMQIASYHMDETFARIISTPGAMQIMVSKDQVFKEKQPVIIADCYHAEIHDVEWIKQTHQGQLIKLIKPLLFHYSDKAYLGRWIEEKWLIHLNAKKKPALYFKSSQLEELSSKVNVLEASARLNNGKTLVDVTLGIEGHQDYRFLTGMRNR